MSSPPSRGDTTLLAAPLAMVRLDPMLFSVVFAAGPADELPELLASGSFCSLVGKLRFAERDGSIDAVAGGSTID